MSEFRVPIELGKVREIVRALKSSNPAYVEGEEPIAPPGFYYGVSYLWGNSWEEPGDSELGKVDVDASRLLHAEEEVSFHGPPPRAGTTLQARQRIESSYEKTNRRGKTLRFFVAVTEFRNESGSLVAESRNTVVEPPPPEDEEEGR